MLSETTSHGRINTGDLLKITEAKNTVVVTRGAGWGQTQEEWVYV